MSKNAFTLIEVTISLFLMTILVLLLTLCLKMTMKTSENFLDFTDYDYAMAHKKIFNSYVSSKKVTDLTYAVVMTDDEHKEKVMLNFYGSEIVIKKKKNANYYAGDIILLRNLSHREFEVKNGVVRVSYVDKKNHKREMYFRLKDEEKEKEEKAKKEKEESLKKEKEDSEKSKDEKKQES